MNEKIKQAFKLFCEQYVKDLNRYTNKEIAKDHFYNPKYECGLQFDGQTVYIADILGAFDNMEELIKSKDEYIAKILNDNKILRNENKSLTKTISQLTEADYYFITSMALDMLKGNSNFALMYVDNIFCLVDTKDNSFDVIDNYDIDTENIGKSKCQELNYLREFAKIMSSRRLINPRLKDSIMFYDVEKRHSETEFDLVKKVVEKYGKKRD